MRKSAAYILIIIAAAAALAGAQSARVDTVHDTIVVHDTVLVKSADDSENENIEIIKAAERIESGLSFIYWIIGIFITIFVGLSAFNMYKSYRIDKELAKAKQAREEAGKARRDAEKAKREAEKTIKDSEIKIEKYREEALKAARSAEAYSRFINGNYLFAEKNYEDAISEYTRVIKLFGKNNSNAAYAYNNRGLAKYNNRNYDGAIADYTKAIGLYTNDNDKAYAYFNRGIAKRQKGDHAETKEEKRKWYNDAIKDFEKALQLNPEYENAKRGIKITKEKLKKLN